MQPYAGVLDVDDGLVKDVTLYLKCHWLLRYDVGPFLMVYLCLFTLALSDPSANVITMPLNAASAPPATFQPSSGDSSSTGALPFASLSLKMVGLIAIPVVLTVHLILFLLAQYSVALRSRLGHREVQNVNSSDCVHVRAVQNAGKDRLVHLVPAAQPSSVSIAGNDFHVRGKNFEFQKVTYTYDSEKNTFVRLHYPCKAPAKLFLHSTGVRSLEDLRTSFMKWGKNEFDIPIPGFLDLYVEHLVAPFFVFQVLCLLLWSLDDYWYYSLLTLCMLMFFEGMLCRQRQASLMMLRQMRRPPFDLFVFRGGLWEEQSSDEIFPGDVISLAAADPSRRKKKGSRSQRHQDEYSASSQTEERVVPCDALLIRGSCVVNEAMLTGESVPQLKETLRNADDRETAEVDLGMDNNVDASWRRHLVFGGTTLLQHQAMASTEEDDAAKAGFGPSFGMGGPSMIKKQGSGNFDIPKPPDAGCIAVVVRTGYGTSQGGLMRKILFATERVTANSSETFYFIGVLVIFAFAASAVVLHWGLQDESRNRFKLVLHCIMIVTSVVPPELPMELSLAVTNSLAALSHGLVFCTEPFRIPYAGKLDILCFDKTGTLTKDKMILKGIVGAQDFIPSLPVTSSKTRASSTTAAGMEDLPSSLVISAVEKPPGCSDIVVSIMGACHSLMLSARGTNVVGDPLEVATMEASGFLFSGDGSTLVNVTRGVTLKLRYRFPFSSALKRMSVVVESVAASRASATVESLHLTTNTPSPSSSSVSATSSSSLAASALFLYTKGAPEVLEDRIVNLPAFYRPTYLHHMNMGKRVLTIACKKLLPGTRFDDSPRNEMETGLTFIGFLVFDCDVKPDSKSVIRDLRGSDHKVVMITGDSAYTAADVAKRLGMLKSDAPVVILQGGDEAPGGSTSSSAPVSPSARTLSWGFLNSDQKHIPFNIANVATLAKTHSLCVTGPALTALTQPSTPVPATSSKAASGAHANAPAPTHAPTHAPTLLSALSPHVTIFARVSPAQKEAIVLSLNDTGAFTLMCGDGTNDVGALKAAHVGVSIVNDPELEGRIETLRDPSSSSSGHKSQAAGDKKPKGQSAKDRVARAMAELHEMESDPTIVKLGDASIASPFTARRTSIDSVLTVLRQGRCTLVTTIQVYKILALNCLVSAYMMSALYLRGLKQGDMQMTAGGLITAALFFFLSQAKPVSRIASSKPPSSIFAPSVALSIAGQFVVHLTCLIVTITLCEQYMATEDPSLSADGKFQPNVINSAVYLLASTMQINNFVVNYRGHPFTQSIQDNTYLWRSVQAIYFFLLLLAGGQVEPLNDFLQMAPFPSSNFQASLVAILAVNFAASFGIEKLCQRLE